MTLMLKGDNIVERDDNAKRSQEGLALTARQCQLHDITAAIPWRPLTHRAPPEGRDLDPSFPCPEDPAQGPRT